MFLVFLIAVVLFFAFIFSLSFWLGNDKSAPTKPDGTPYSAEITSSVHSSLKRVGRNLTATTGAALVAFVGWYFLYYDKEDKVSERAALAAEKQCNDEISAYVMTQEFVKKRLKSPSTAKFPLITSAESVALGGCKFSVSSYVDAQNSFGAVTRTHYSARIEYIPDTKKWRIVALDM